MAGRLTGVDVTGVSGEHQTVHITQVPSALPESVSPATHGKSIIMSVIYNPNKWLQ